MNQQKILALCIFSLALLSLSIGCGSKSVESSPDTVKVKGIPLEERMQQKKKVDTLIAEVQKGIDKTKFIVDMFRKHQSSNAQQGTAEQKETFTALDFILAVNKEMQKKVPEPQKATEPAAEFEGQANQLVRLGSIELPFPGVAENCRQVETRLESALIYDETSEEKQKVKQAIGEKLTYSLKSCGSEGVFLPVVTAEWVGSSLEIKMNNKNFATTLQGMQMADSALGSSCKIQQDSQKMLESISCENFTVQISASEIAQVKVMTFRNYGEVRFEASAEIFANGKKKATSAIQVLANGEVKLELKPVEEEATASK